MESNFRQISVICIFFMLMAANAVSCIPIREFDSMLDSLRERGYDLFCNAIVTSDLQFDVLSYQNQNQTQEEDSRNNNNNGNSRYSFTFFAPTDASLFALDMTQTASSYIDTLRFHVVPRRLSVAELHLLADGYALPTLLYQRRLEVTRSAAYAAGISVGGVEIAFPGLFYGRHVAVHGLSGILSLRSNAVAGIPTVPPSPVPVVSPIGSAVRRSRSSANRPENRTVLAPSSRSVRPVPKLVSFNVTSRRRPHPPVQAPAPEPNDATRQAPATSPVNGIVESPEPEADWTDHSPADSLADSPASLDDAPVGTPVASSPMYPDSEISFPPEGFSDAAAPAPMELESMAPKKSSVSIMETSNGDLEGAIGTAEKSEPSSDGMMRNCDVGIGLKDYDDRLYNMQCYAS